MRYQVYQCLKPEIRRELGFSNKLPLREDFTLVYESEIPGGRDDQVVLDELFELHNLQHRPNPQGMTSMSVGDVVVLENRAYQCDRIGWKVIPHWGEST